MKTLRFTIALVFFANVLFVNAQETIEVFYEVDTMPEYPDGMETLIKDIKALVKYPEEALKQGITGRIYVTFVVNKQGKIEYTTIARGVGPILDKEALQVINQLTKIWKPGIKGGKAVNVGITLVFDFKENKKIDVFLPNPNS